jgi:L-threonylcarbamoyladenylate synthase
MNAVAKAVAVLRRGGLVAFPTETVYGLGADATNAHAVARIFAAKGRPTSNPLIVHVADQTVAQRYAAVWPESARQLARAFWPGPLTLVVPKRDLIVPQATAGLSTVGLRSPDHPLALELLRHFDGPIAAPSANRSTRVSPTTAKHVRDELGDSVDYILDGGPCRVGIESTVLDLSGDAPTILRPGAVTAEQIEEHIGPVRTFNGHVAQSTAAMSPGQQAIHYAPHAAAYRFDTHQIAQVAQWCQANPKLSWAILMLESSQLHPAMATLLPLIGAEPPGGSHRLILMPDDAEDYARQLYATLRSLDDHGTKTIWVQMPPPSPPWAAVRDRLTRATQPV